jgi:short-subunit dehydrogenase
MFNRSFSFKNSCVWITGASSGIGESLSIELAKRGAIVALTARSEDKLEALCQRIKQQGGKAYSFPGDVCDLQAMKAISNSILQSIGSIDVCIPNAGTHLFTVPENFDSSEYMSIMSLNFGGSLHVIEAVLPSMLERKAGIIVPIASLAGYRGLPRAAAYGASKAAMINFFESIRFHLKESGLSVCIVNPGFVKTPLTDKNDFYMPFLVDCEYTANAICNGIEKRRKEIVFPFLFACIMKFARVLPYSIYEKIVDRLW